jgi:chloride channel protein, CIC family
VFGVELTHAQSLLLPLLVACAAAHLVSTLVLRRSILTEKVARRGYHLSREYAVDPLEILFAREVMRTDIVTLRSDATFDDMVAALVVDPAKGPQRLYPVVNEAKHLLGVASRVDLQRIVGDGAEAIDGRLARIVHAAPLVAFATEPLRVVVQRMASSGLTRFPIVAPTPTREVIGLIALDDLLRARRLNLDAERRRERTLGFGSLFGFIRGRPAQANDED